MRLQSAIFTLGDTLFTPDGAAREGLDKALSLFKMEGVWLGAGTVSWKAPRSGARRGDGAQRGGRAKSARKGGASLVFPLRADRIRRALQGGQRHDVRARDEAPALAKRRYDRLFRLACGDPKREGRGFSHRGGAGKCGRGGLVDDAATRHAEPCAVQRIAVRFCVNFGKTTGFDVFLVLVAVFLNCDIVRI